jgi:putative ABC transport system permease protein
MSFFQADLSLSKNFNLLLSVAGASIVMGFLAGIYPAVYTTSFKPAIALSGSFSTSSGKTLRNILIVIQFITVVFLIIVASFIKIQHDYMQDKSWGVRKDNIIYLNRWNLHNSEAFENELKKNPNITDITYGSFLPGTESSEMMGWGRSLDDVRINMFVWPVSHSYQFSVFTRACQTDSFYCWSNIFVLAG